MFDSMRQFGVPFAALPAIPKACRDHAPWRPVAPRQVFMEIPSLIVRLRACRPTSWDDTGDNRGVRLDITVTCLAGHVQCDLPLPKTPKSAILASKSPGILTNID